MVPYVTHLCLGEPSEASPPAVPFLCIPPVPSVPKHTRCAQHAGPGSASFPETHLKTKNENLSARSSDGRGFCIFLMYLCVSVFL